MFFSEVDDWQPIKLEQENVKDVNGIFVVFEGTDGAGKTTTIDLVKKELEQIGLNVICMKTPTDFLRSGGMWKIWNEQKVSGDELFDYGLSVMAFGERIAYHQKCILPALDNNIVLMDRYILSSLVYECGEIHERLAKLLVKPDIGYVLSANINNVLARIENRDYEKLCEGEDVVLNDLIRRYIELANINGYEILDTNSQSSQECAFNIVNQILVKYQQRNC